MVLLNSNTTLDIATSTTREANIFPTVDSANRSAADLDIPGPATVEIATGAVADITADESHSSSTVTAEESSMQRDITQKCLRLPSSIFNSSLPTAI